MSGVNYATIKDLARTHGCRVTDLIALAPANDPFYCGCGFHIAAGKWFAGLWERFDFPAGVHIRRIHYRLISQDEPALAENGKPYLNTDECWKALGEASKHARYLGLVPVDSFTDRRNPSPMIFLPDEIMPLKFYVEGEDVEDGMYLPHLPDLPTFELTEPTIDQRYHLEIWCEKSTMNDELIPLCRKYGANLVTGVGELSITRVRDLMHRAAASGKPVRVFYVSDFDPAGKSMPVAVARKVEFFIRRDFPDLDLKIFSSILTQDQCREYHLPRTPIKKTERRAASFEKRFGEGATELDALEALHPGVFRQILSQAIDRYFDDDLMLRVHGVRSDLREALAASREKVLERHTERTSVLEEKYEEIREYLEAWQEEAQHVWQAIAAELEAAAPDIGDYPKPAAKVAGEPEDALFDSSRPYLDQIIHYKVFQGKEPVELSGDAPGGAT